MTQINRFGAGFPPAKAHPPPAVYQSYQPPGGMSTHPPQVDLGKTKQCETPLSEQIRTNKIHLSIHRTWQILSQQIIV